MNDLFARSARMAGAAVAHPLAFTLALILILVWAACGPLLHYSENWQLIINTSTSILTFLMIFLLQNMQNRDSRAMQAKLNELIRAQKGARTEMVDLENLTEEELTRYCEEFKNLHLQYSEILSNRRSSHQARADKAAIADGGNNRATQVQPQGQQVHDG